MAHELPEGTVTVLFTDVVGSTDLTTRRGDEAAQGILRTQRELVRRQVEQHSGHEVKSLGDGFMVAFASARRAVACAVGIQKALEQHNRQHPDQQVQVRIGLNTGEAIQEEADLFGEAVNAAARIAAKAKGGQILLSEAVRGVLGRARDVELVDRGRFRLKGFPERWHLYEATWQETEGPIAVVPALAERTPFVGRDSERAELRRLLDQTIRGQGTLVMIGGEPGVGKTRDYETGAPLLTEALAMAEELGDRHLLGGVLHGKAMVHFWYGQPREAVESGLRAVEFLRSAGDLWNLAEVLWVTQHALLGLGRFEEAAEMAVEAEPLTERLGHVLALPLIRRGIAFGQFMVTGDINRFGEFLKADLELCRSAGMPGISNSYTWLGVTHFWRGELGQGLESFEEGARLDPPGPLAGVGWGTLFLGKAYSGDRDSALAMLDDKMSSLPRPGRANVLGAWAMLFAAVEGLTVLGEREKAAKLYPLVLEAVDTGAVVSGSYLLLHAVAGMAAAGEHWEKAEGHYQTALRQAHELPVVIEQPEVRRWYARMLIDRDAPGDRENARELLTEAVAMYRRIGMPKHVEMAEALLGGI